MIGIDTNILVRFFTGDDNGKLQKVRELLQRKSGVYYINLMTLCEMVWVLRSTYRYSMEEVREALGFVMNTDGLEIEKPDIVQQALEAVTSSVGFADRMIGLVNRRAGCETTLTFDKAAAKLDEFTLLA